MPDGAGCGPLGRALQLPTPQLQWGADPPLPCSGRQNHGGPSNRLFWGTGGQHMWAWLLTDACRDFRPGLSCHLAPGPYFPGSVPACAGRSGRQADSPAGGATEACQSQRRLCWVRRQAGECHGASAWASLGLRGGVGLLRAELKLRGREPRAQRSGGMAPGCA